MKNFKFKCRKCGHIIEIPEKTESVLCGNCATWNRSRNLFAALDQETGVESPGDSVLQKVPGSTDSEIPGQGQPVPAEEDEAAQRPGIFTVMALLFFIIPLVNFILFKFKLPPYITLIVVAAVLVIYLITKKRS
mgnify:CR=1 FL=1